MARLVGSTDFGGLVEACATARGIPAADIEKDIWVVQALRSVFRPVDRATVILWIGQAGRMGLVRLAATYI